MTAIIAIDAAWTSTQPSGIALLKQSDGIWSCLALAPSYDQYLKQCHGELVDWSDSPVGSSPDVGAILSASQSLLAGERVDIVTIDMPVSQNPINARRESDQAISKAFGGQGCGTHSPNSTRPGQLGAKITEQFREHGYPVATMQTPISSSSHLLEVYPHPALLRLMNVTWRVSYKVSKSNRYWPKTTIETRINKLLAEYSRILAELSLYIQGIESLLPKTLKVTSLSHLKRYEDAIDALVCGWVGMCYLSGSVRPFGDAHSAIWVPEGDIKKLSACT